MARSFGKFIRSVKNVRVKNVCDVAGVFIVEFIGPEGLRYIAIVNDGGEPELIVVCANSPMRQLRHSDFKTDIDRVLEEYSNIRAALVDRLGDGIYPSDDEVSVLLRG